MKNVIIKVGGYGYRSASGGTIQLIMEKDGPIEVSDEEADRIVGLGIAKVYIPTETAESEENEMDGYGFRELQKIAKSLGLNGKGTREELIERISAKKEELEDEEAEEEPEESDDEEQPPVLQAAEPED